MRVSGEGATVHPAISNERCTCTKKKGRLLHPALLNADLFFCFHCPGCCDCGCFRCTRVCLVGYLGN